MICKSKLCPNYFSVNVSVLAVVFRRQFSRYRQFQAKLSEMKLWTRSLLVGHNIMLSWEMPSKTFFAYPDLIIGTLKGSTEKCFNFSAQSQHFTAIRLDPIFPNLPLRSTINVNQKSWYTLHLKDNLILTSFY